MPIKIESEDTPTIPVVWGNPLNHIKTLTGAIRYGLASVSDETRTGRIYASQAANCTRQGVLSSTREDEPSIITPSQAVYYGLGVTIEDMVVKALEKQKVLLFPQYKLPDVGLNLGGFVDAIVLVNGKIKVVEIKSCGELPTKPKADHYAQAMVYASITGLPASLLYFSRHVAGFDGELKIKEFPLTSDPDEIRKVLFSVCYVREVIDLDVIPEIPVKMKSSSDCGFCQFKDNCWQGYPLKKPLISAEQHLVATERALLRVNELVATTSSRRNGVLRHIQTFGTPEAKELLKGNWVTLID